MATQHRVDGDLATIAARHGAKAAAEMPVGWGGASPDPTLYPRPPIIVDIDDTLHPWFTIFLELLEERTGKDIDPDAVKSYNLADVLGFSQEELSEVILETHYHENQGRSPIYSGARKALRKWHAAGYPILIATSRPPEAIDSTIKWLQPKNLPVSILTFVRDKTAYARQRGAVAIIDDRPDVLLSGPPEFVCGAIRQCWHQSLPESALTEENLVIADNWQELYRRLTPLIEQRSAAICAARNGKIDAFSGRREAA